MKALFGHKKRKSREKLRRGWRELIEPGLYRAHRVNCPATKTKTPGMNCTCPFQAHLPGGTKGRRYPQNLRALDIDSARAEKRRRQRASRLGPAEPGLTVSEFFWDAFIPKSQLRPATKRNYARVFRIYLEPLIGHLPLVAFNEEHVAELVAHLTRQAEKRRRLTGRRNPDWTRQQLVPMRSALSTAMRWRRIEENPLRRVDLPEISPRRPGETDVNEDPKTILSREQIDELCRAARQATSKEVTGRRDESFFRTTYELALRNSEARGLRWSDVDFEAQEIRIIRQIDPVTAEESGTKGKKTRTLPVDAQLLDLLAAWKEFCRRNRIPSGIDEYIWQGRIRGSPMGVGVPTLRIAEVQRFAGLVDSGGKPLINLHGLRHSRASHLLLVGVPMLEVSRFLGHTSQLTTASIYAHLVPDEEFAEIKALFRKGSEPSPAPTG